MASPAVSVLQWGPVVVTGISGGPAGPQVGRPVSASMGSGRGDRNQLAQGEVAGLISGFNGVRSW